MLRGIILIVVGIGASASSWAQGYHPGWGSGFKGHIQVSIIHQVYCEEYGSSEGLPAMYLHGGPGGNFEKNVPRLFDLRKYHLVMCDQRGAGRSLPKGSIEENTTQDLVADIEQIRKHFGMNQILLLGSSWGTTLAMKYAETHPAQVSGLILQGTFVAREADISWPIETGSGEVFEHFMNFIPESERGSVLLAYAQRVLFGEESVRREAIDNLVMWQFSLSMATPPSLADTKKMVTRFPQEVKDQVATLMMHYFSNHFFLEKEELVTHLNTVVNLPAVIVHGEMDRASPASSVRDLHDMWEGSILQLIPGVGHNLFDSAVAPVVARAIQSFDGHKFNIHE